MKVIIEALAVFCKQGVYLASLVGVSAAVAIDFSELEG